MITSTHEGYKMKLFVDSENMTSEATSIMNEKTFNVCKEFNLHISIDTNEVNYVIIVSDSRGLLVQEQFKSHESIKSSLWYTVHKFLGLMYDN